MDFGEALNLLKKNLRLAREGWNGKGMFVYYVHADEHKAGTTIENSIANGNGDVECRDYIAMKTAQGDVVPWVASQTDMLAKDWIVLL